MHCAERMTAIEQFEIVAMFERRVRASGYARSRIASCSRATRARNLSFGERNRRHDAALTPPLQVPWRTRGTRGAMAADFARVLADVMGDGEFSRDMERFAGAFAEYRYRLPLVPRAYSRTRLAIAPEYEIVAMNWAPLSVSPIHDHGASRCWVLMLEGVLDVQNFVCDAADLGASSCTFAKPSASICAGRRRSPPRPTELHRVLTRAHAQRVYSLQLYARPLTTYSVVDLHSGQRRVVSATCDLDLSLRQQVHADTAMSLPTTGARALPPSGEPARRNDSYVRRRAKRFGVAGRHPRVDTRPILPDSNAAA